jgi:hypothetical protein
MTQPERLANYQRTRREAGVAVVGWVVAFAWTVGVSWWLGQQRPVALWLGVPKWVLLGVALPWVGCFLFNCWYTLVYQKERSA